jgi:hypothetical protein
MVIVILTGKIALIVTIILIVRVKVKVMIVNADLYKTIVTDTVTVVKGILVTTRWTPCSLQRLSKGCALQAAC